MTTTWFIVARAVHIGACLLFFGMLAFDRCVAAAIFTGGKTEAGDYWSARIRLFNLVLLPMILLSGIGWFALVAMTMSGQPLQVEILKIVWERTQFGAVWKLRLGFWLVAVVMATLLQFFKSPAKIWIWSQWFLGANLLGSLAWAGHGQEYSPWHLAADVLHLLVAGFWPAGLLPLILLVKKIRSRPAPADGNLLAVLVRRFSAISLVSVALLTITGFINSWFLVGSFANLFQQAYGRWLLVKIILFGFIVAIGAVNLLQLKPRLGNENLQGSDSGPAAAQLQVNVQTELFIGLVIIVSVAVLGILPPASH